MSDIAEEKKKVLRDDELEGVSGGDLHAIQAVLIAMIVGESKGLGLTLEETVESVIEGMNKDSIEYSQAVALVHELWNQA